MFRRAFWKLWGRAFIRWTTFLRPATAFLATLGAVNTIVETAKRLPDEVYGTFNGIATQTQYWLAAGFFFIILFRDTKPLSFVTAKLPDMDTSVTFEVEDIFSTPGAILLPVNTTFDTDTQRKVVDPASIFGQFLGKNLISLEMLEAEITRQLRDVSFEQLQGQRVGKSARYPLGTVVIIDVKERRYFLLAMADCNEHGDARALEGEVFQAMAAFWTCVQDRGGLIDDIRIPVVGTGFGKVHTKVEFMAREHVLQFLAASRSRKICRQLRICLRWEDVVRDAVDLADLREFLRQSMKFQTQQGAEQVVGQVI